MATLVRVCLMILLLPLVACGPASIPARLPGSAAQQSLAPPKHLSIAIISEPTGFNLAVETARLSITQSGLAYYLFPGLTVKDHQGTLRATVGEAVPTVDNGLWKVSPDGRMETTHPIRPGARWHDGTPLTGEDLSFTVAVVSDKGLPEFRQLGLELIDKIEAGPTSALHSSQARIAERSYQGTNNGRYQSPELDTLVDRFQRTISWNQRMQVAGQIVHHFTDQLPVLSLFYDALPVFINNRVTNVYPGGYLAWNVHEWDIK